MSQPGLSNRIAPLSGVIFHAKSFGTEPNAIAAHSAANRLIPKSCPVKLSDILQGKWLGHPLHSAMVHIPVGGWIAACFLDIVTWLHWMHGGGQLATYCVAAGLLGALLAVPPGIADWMPIKKEKPAWKLGLYHMSINAAAVVVWVVNLGLRLNSEESVTSTILLTSLLGTALISISGYLGSLMVFDQGTSVARESKKEWREIARRGGARVPEEK
jgi:uncharacterized membrane protein